MSPLQTIMRSTTCSANSAVAKAWRRSRLAERFAPSGAPQHAQSPIDRGHGAAPHEAVSDDRRRKRSSRGARTSRTPRDKAQRAHRAALPEPDHAGRPRADRRRGARPASVSELSCSSIHPTKHSGLARSRSPAQWIRIPSPQRESSGVTTPRTQAPPSPPGAGRRAPGPPFREIVPFRSSGCAAPPTRRARRTRRNAIANEMAPCGTPRWTRAKFAWKRDRGRAAPEYPGPLPM